MVVMMTIRITEQMMTWEVDFISSEFLFTFPPHIHLLSTFSSPHFPRYPEDTVAWGRDGSVVKGAFKNVQPPWWWRIGVQLSEKIAALTLADAVRVDLFYHEGRVILNEYTLGPSGAASPSAKDGGRYPDV